VQWRVRIAKRMAAIYHVGSGPTSSLFYKRLALSNKHANEYLKNARNYYYSSVETQHDGCSTFTFFNARTAVRLNNKTQLSLGKTRYSLYSFCCSNDFQDHRRSM